MGTRTMINSMYIGRKDTNALTYTRYPALAVGTTLTASGMTTGAYAYAAAGANEAQIIAAALITTYYWVAGCAVSTPSNPSVFVIKIMDGLITAGVTLFEMQFGEIIGTGLQGITQCVPIPVGVQANIGTCGDAASDNALADDTINCSVLVMA